MPPFSTRSLPRISVEFDPNHVRQVEAMLVNLPLAANRAMVSAINDTGRQQLGRANRLIRQEVNLKTAIVKRHLRFLPATVNKPRGLFRVFSRFPRLSLKYFGARQTKKGVSIQIYKGEGRTTVPGTFGPKIAKLHGHVYKRAGKARFPLVKQYGPSVVDVFLRKGLDRIVIEDAGKSIRENLNRRVRLALLREAGIVRAARGAA